MSQFDTEGQEGADGPTIIYVLLAFSIIIIIWATRKRISRIEDLDYESGISLYGVVTGISDGDGFKFFDCPWLMSTSYTSRDDRLYVRLAGIDAPEMGNSHTPGQFFAKESKEYLRSLIQGKNIKIKVLGIDQYNRVLVVAYLPRWLIRWFFFNRFFPIRFCEWCLVCLGFFLASFSKWLKNFFYINVNLKMVENGYACVYIGRDAVYDEYKKTLFSLQEKAKRDKKGMWISPNVETPMRFKKIHRV